MLLAIKSNLSTAEAKASLVALLSMNIGGHEYIDGFRPYQPNKTDDNYWTLDSGNDWKAKFFPEKPKQIEIRYRYQCKGNHYEEALAGWLKVLIGAEPVTN